MRSHLGTRCHEAGPFGSALGCEGSVRAGMCERRHCSGRGVREHTQYHLPHGHAPVVPRCCWLQLRFSYVCFIWWNCLCTG